MRSRDSRFLPQIAGAPIANNVSLASDGASAVWAYDSTSAWESVDAGVTWTSVSLPQGVSPWIVALHDGGAVLTGKSPTPVYIRKSAGAQWTSEPVDAPGLTDLSSYPVTDLLWTSTGTVAMTAWCTVFLHREEQLP